MQRLYLSSIAIFVKLELSALYFIDINKIEILNCSH